MDTDIDNRKIISAITHFFHSIDFGSFGEAKGMRHTHTHTIIPLHISFLIRFFLSLPILFGLNFYDEQKKQNIKIICVSLVFFFFLNGL